MRHMEKPGEFDDTPDFSGEVPSDADEYTMPGGASDLDGDGSAHLVNDERVGSDASLDDFEGQFDTAETTALVEQLAVERASVLDFPESEREGTYALLDAYARRGEAVEEDGEIGLENRLSAELMKAYGIHDDEVVTFACDATDEMPACCGFTAIREVVRNVPLSEEEGAPSMEMTCSEKRFFLMFSGAGNDELKDIDMGITVVARGEAVGASPDRRAWTVYIPENLTLGEVRAILAAIEEAQSGA